MSEHTGQFKLGFGNRKLPDQLKRMFWFGQPKYKSQSFDTELSLVQKHVGNAQSSLWAGFEPARGDPIGFQVQRLNLSAITAWNQLICQFVSGISTSPLKQKPFVVFASVDLIMIPLSHEAVMAERLRRWTRNPMGFPRAGSNPAHSDMTVVKHVWVQQTLFCVGTLILQHRDYVACHWSSSKWRNFKIVRIHIVSPFHMLLIGWLLICRLFALWHI